MIRNFDNQYEQIQKHIQDKADELQHSKASASHSAKMLTAKKTSQWVKRTGTGQVTASGFSAGGSQLTGPITAAKKTEPLMQPNDSPMPQVDSALRGDLNGTITAGSPEPIRVENGSAE